MCGIVSIFAYNNPLGVDHEELRRIRDQMTHRGPDGSGEWYSEDGRVGLGHRRLAIIDLSERGNQPMKTEDSSLVITFNGEVYNYMSLRVELERKGYRFHSQSDTEVLLHLYAEKGSGMVNDLRGMFAFAIWDNKRKGLFIARDPFGIKPLYYADDGKTFYVASQVKALLRAAHMDTRPDAAGHVGFFLWGHVPEPFTLYRGIRALPAGGWLWVDASGRREQRRFFDISEVMACKPAGDKFLSLSESREILKEALLDTVRHHLVADVPVGVFLSAGMDSTALAALAREVGVEELLTVTLGFQEFIGTQNDEVPLAEVTARKLAANHTTRWVDREDFEQRLEHMLACMDQPTIDGVNTYFVSLAAHEAGLKVAISGVGGDELFAGYSDFQEIPLLVRVVRPIAKVPFLGRGFRFVSAPIVKHFTSPKYAGIFEYGGDWPGAYLLRRGLFMPWELHRVLDGELVREGWYGLRTLPALAGTIEGVENDRLGVTALETAWYMRNQLLRDTDWASMAHSLEVRVPFADTQLLRTVSSLVNSGRPPIKQDVLSSSSESLPPPLFNRSKTGFSVPVREWLAEQVCLDDQWSRQGLRGWARSLYARATQIGSERGSMRKV
jgi:asparagine synthase (glutamine-hydrolysing)